MGDFPNQIGVQPAPAVEGDFASANTPFTVLAGPGGFVAGASGVTIGRFAWNVATALDGDNVPSIINSFGAGLPLGFVHREQQGLIVTYLGAYGMTIQPGFMTILTNSGDFWVKNNGTTQALIGQKAFAKLSDGSISFAAAGSTPSSATLTGSIGAQTNAFTGSIAGNVLTVTAVSQGTIVPGTALTGAGLATGTKIVGQLSETTGGVGTYALNIPEQTIASESMTGTYGLLTVASVSVGSVGVGDVLSGTGGGGVTAGTTITGLGTGTGAAGTYYVDTTQTVAVGTVMGSSLSIETKWICMSPGLAGELVKMSSRPNG
jgi:hypothetical protein